VSAHLGALFVDRGVHHAAEDVLVSTPVLRPARVASALWVLVLALLCTYEYGVHDHTHVMIIMHHIQ